MKTQQRPKRNMPDRNPLIERYRKNPFLRALVSLVPYGSNIEIAILTKWDRIREERLRELFDTLAETNLIDRPELLDSEDFLHRFFCTLKFATNTRQREKIRMFARLLDSSMVLDGELSDTDEFEDFAKILDELSYRELRALTILDRFTETPRSSDQNDLQWTKTFWDEFCQQLSDELPIPFEESTEYMTRISRSGCYQEFVGFWDLQPGIGKLTPTYFRLKKYTLASSRS